MTNRAFLLETLGEAERLRNDMDRLVQSIRSRLDLGDAAPGAPSGRSVDDQWPVDPTTVDTSNTHLWIEPKVAADLTRCGIDKIYRLCRAGEIAIRLEGRWLVNRHRLFRKVPKPLI